MNLTVRSGFEMKFQTAQSFRSFRLELFFRELQWSSQQDLLPSSHSSQIGNIIGRVRIIFSSSCLTIFQSPFVSFLCVCSCLSDAASGLSDGNDGSSTSGGRHEGRSMKRNQRRSVRSRSRHEKGTKAKLNVLSVCTWCVKHFCFVTQLSVIFRSLADL